MKQVSRVGEKFEKRSFFSNLIFLPSGGSFRKLLAGQTSAEDPGTHVAVPKISSELGVLLLVLAKCSYLPADKERKLWDGMIPLKEILWEGLLAFQALFSPGVLLWGRIAKDSLCSGV